MKKYYINVHIAILEEYFELAIGYLSNYNITGIEEKTDEIIVTIPSIEWNEIIEKMIESDLNLLDVNAKIKKIEKIEDENWNAEWEKNISPIIIDDIAITPEWEVNNIEAKYKVIINPKMSFGTGHHCTTRLMCKLLKKYVVPNSKWIDAGCGTAVLSILTILLGADSVFAFDNDEWSILNSKENVDLNLVNEKIGLYHSSIDDIVLPESDGIAANMYTHLLKPNMTKFLSSLVKSNGYLIISGVLVYDRDDIIKAATEKGFEHIETLQEDEWIASVFKPKGIA